MKILNSLLLLLLGPALFGQVTLIRQNPESGGNQAQAEWTKPRPQPGPSAALSRTQLSARIILGGQGGVDANGDQVGDLYTDSTVSLVQPLGQSSALNIGAAALRRKLIDGDEQNYSLTAGLRAERWSLDLSGAYSDQTQNISDPDTSLLESTGEQNISIDAALQTGLIPTVPIALSYTLDGDKRFENAVQVGNNSDQNISLTAAGTLGSIDLDSEAHLALGYDYQKNMRTSGAGGALSVKIPVLRFLEIEPGLSSSTSLTEYRTTGYEDRTTSLDSQLALYFPLLSPDRDLNIRLIGGRTDLWSTETGPSGPDDSHSVVWQAESGFDLSLQSGFSSGAAYAFGKTLGGSSSHTGAANLGWANPDDGATFQSVDGGSDLTASLSNSGVQQSLHVGWHAGLLLQPVKSMHINGGYTGGWNSAASAPWNHRLEAELSQTPDPLLEYRLNLALADSISPVNHILSTDNAAELILRPSWKLKVYTVTLSENLSVGWTVPAQDQSDILSKTSTGVAIPLFSFLNFRYTFTWEWINRIAPGRSAGNAYSHLMGLGLSGTPLPFTLSTDYSLSHGYRGLRHDINSSLDIPFSKGFGLKGSFSLSAYRENGTLNTPFLVGLNGAYEY